MANNFEQTAKVAERALAGEEKYSWFVYRYVNAYQDKIKNRVRRFSAFALMVHGVELRHSFESWVDAFAFAQQWDGGDQC